MKVNCSISSTRRKALLMCLVWTAVSVGVCRGEGTCRPRVPVLDNGADVPPGEYLKSCSGCFLHEQGAVLRCRSCFGSMGRDGPAEIEVARCASFMNDDGRLVCSFVAQENAPDVPRGPYLRTCGGCVVAPPDDGAGTGTPLLSCTECLNRVGERHWAELDYAAPDAVCPPGQSVANDDGRLLCAPVSEDEAEGQTQEQDKQQHSEL